MVNVTVAQLPGHSRGTTFYSRLPPLGAAAVWTPSHKNPATPLTAQWKRAVAEKSHVDVHAQYAFRVLRFFGRLDRSVDRGGKTKKTVQNSSQSVKIIVKFIAESKLLFYVSHALLSIADLCDNYRVSGALEKLEHETILQDRASDR